MKRLIAVIVLAVGMAVPAAAQTRTFVYRGCDVWGCVTTQLSGDLAFGLPIYGATAQWYFLGALQTTQEAAPPGFTMRTANWSFSDFVGQEANTHTFDGPWGGLWVERADFSTDFTAPRITGQVELCANPGHILCVDGYTDYGRVTLGLVSVTTAPEPASFGLLGAGLVVLFMVRLMTSPVGRRSQAWHTL